jgi:hypothetical protein
VLRGSRGAGKGAKDEEPGAVGRGGPWATGEGTVRSHVCSRS